MKTLLFAVFPALALAQPRPLIVVPQCGQPNQIPVTINVSTGGGITFPLLVCALLDANSFRVDATTNPPTLRFIGSTASAGPTFVDQVALAGAIDGTNSIFTLPDIPNPVASAHVHRNGLQLRLGIDFNLSGNTVTFLPGAIPQAGDILTGDYRK